MHTDPSRNRPGEHIGAGEDDTGGAMDMLCVGDTVG